ncbi:putative Actin [Trypanosoma vivax]|uniref:Putative actin-related protein 3 n=1 Tax=Trypanosoma vivax (strain Y486) TaxID=1055687 RepID=G0U265_TRYVY|nr:putative actin-related protein 3 [Trypanosoma vivax]KAH8611528.1 putative Actin [Trypanosoma vivax]CCC50368.1 putative actin-related protein 3 [Trypanosoma vivax Y486]
MAHPVVVIDNGTGYTKMGYAGNDDPTYVIPTVYADNENPNRRSPDAWGDLDFFVGDEAVAHAGTYSLSCPIKHGVIEDWDKMERMWQHCIYKYLRVAPEEHGFLITEPPANPPENREWTAEVMFETFGVKQLHIAVQGALALRATWTSEKSQQLGLAGKDTGVVIDSGAGVTHVVPIVEGFVMHHAIQRIPLAGRDINNFILELLLDRGETLPHGDEAVRVAQRIKERYCYVARDMAREFEMYDSDLQSHISKHREVCSGTGKSFHIDVGYEKFVGPELFFHPEMLSSEWTTPLPAVVEQAVWSCPIDCRRPLYKNVVLSGGSTMFPKFDKRLQKDLRTIVDSRAKKNTKALGDTRREITYEVNVVSHERQRYAVWYGGSMLGASQDFVSIAKTKQEYEECGPYICRQSNMFHSVFD